MDDVATIRDKLEILNSYISRRFSQLKPGTAGEMRHVLWAEGISKKPFTIHPP